MQRVGSPPIRARTSQSPQEEKLRRYEKVMNPSSRKNKSRWFSPVNSFNSCAIIVISLSFITTVTTYFVLSLHHVENEEIELTTEETRLIVPNTYLYNYIEVLDKSSRIHTFFYKQFPPLTNSVWIELNETVEMEGNTSKYWARYLNKGSSVKLTWNTDDVASLFVLRGSFDMERWLENPNDKYVQIVNQSSSNSLNFSILESDDYFFVLENRQSTRMKGVMHLKVLATLFDTAKATGFFDGSFRMDFPFGSAQYLVLTNPSKVYSELVAISLSSSRLTLIFFFAFTVQFLSLCSCVVWRLSMPSKREVRETFTV